MAYPKKKYIIPQMRGIYCCKNAIMFLNSDCMIYVATSMVTSNIQRKTDQ